MQAMETTTRTQWLIDPAHSEIGFRVKHLVFSNVRGTFRNVDARVFTMGDDFSQAEVDVIIDPASINTGIEQRDEHLRSGDFFDAEQFKEIRFTASTLVPTETNGRYIMYGELAMKGIKNEVKLDVEFGPQITDPYGNEKALFSIDGKINRKEWGLNYNAALEAGGVLISEDVWIHCEIQLIKQK